MHVYQVLPCKYRKVWQLLQHLQAIHLVVLDTFVGIHKADVSVQIIQSAHSLERVTDALHVVDINALKKWK